MKLVPWTYPLRSLSVRWSSSLFSAVGIACTVGVLTAILALGAGLDQVYSETGSEEILIYLRPGATSEGESSFRLNQIDLLAKERPEIAKDSSGAPMAAGESYLAIVLERTTGGTTNVPIRGIGEKSVEIQGHRFRITKGRPINFGADEIMVGAGVVNRIKNCRIGDSLELNLTPFRVVGVFEHDGAYGSEIWGDVDRISSALNLPARQRLVARVVPGTNVDQVAAELENDKQIPAKVDTERGYLSSQKDRLGAVILFLARAVALIMAVGAVLGATTTMLASVGSRTREVGVLLATGFSRVAIFLSFVFESALIGLAGGILGALGVLPINGIETGTTNAQTFTEVAFSFRVTPGLLAIAVGVAVMLGIFGGSIPAFRAARLIPTAALRRR